MMVVPVLITSCQVSEYPKKGPLIPQINMIPTAVKLAAGLPVAFVMFWENRENKFFPSFRFSAERFNENFFFGGIPAGFIFYATRSTIFSSISSSTSYCTPLSCAAITLQLYRVRSYIMHHVQYNHHELYACGYTNNPPELTTTGVYFNILRLNSNVLCSSSRLQVLS